VLQQELNIRLPLGLVVLVAQLVEITTEQTAGTPQLLALQLQKVQVGLVRTL
jgi:hypothetical protein